MSKGSLVGLPRRATPCILGRMAPFSTLRCRTLSSARRLTVLPRPRTSRCLPMGRWPYRPHRSDTCSEANKAHVCAQNVHSRALIMRSGSRTEFSALLYAAKHFLAPTQRAATRYPNTRSKDQIAYACSAFIYSLTSDHRATHGAVTADHPKLPKGHCVRTVHVSKC